MIFLHVEKEESRYIVKVDEYDLSTHDVPPDIGANIKCIYSHDRYEILGDVVSCIETKNGGSLHSDDFEHLIGVLDTSYVETLFKYRKREISKKVETQRKGKSLFSLRV